MVPVRVNYSIHLLLDKKAFGHQVVCGEKVHHSIVTQNEQILRNCEINTQCIDCKCDEEVNKKALRSQRGNDPDRLRKQDYIVIPVDSLYIGLSFFLWLYFNLQISRNR